MTRTDNRFLVVNERYMNPTIQGEGPAIGTPCTFMRLSGCNLQCGINGGWKCDSSYTWDWKGVNGIKYNPRVESSRDSFDDIKRWLKRFNDETAVRLLVITGGEPILQDHRLSLLLLELADERWWVNNDWKVHMETNGTMIPLFTKGLVDLYCVSPKLANSGNHISDRLSIDALRWFSGVPDVSAFKFVVCRVEDFSEIDDIVKQCGILPSRVYIMPEGISKSRIEEGLGELVDATIDRGYNLTTRLHIQVFGNVRGT